MDLREQILSFKLLALEEGIARFFIRCDCSPTGSLNPKLLFDQLSERLGLIEEPEYCRLALWADKIGMIPLWGRKELSV